MAGASRDDIAPSTRIISSGRRPEWTGTPGAPASVVNPPVWRASTHLYPDCAALAAGVHNNEDGRFFYGRRGAPTQWALAEALTDLEPGAGGTVLYPSGLAAVVGALLAVLRPGDVLLMTDNAYDPSRSAGMGLLAEFGVETRFFAPDDHAAYAALFCENTRAVVLESPGSLTMEVQDVPELARIAHAHGTAVLLDNTWASSLGFAAISHGVDLSISALTKHVGGHSDLMMGAVTATPEWYPKLRASAQALGHVVSPDDAALALRGLRTLAVRLQRQTASALTIARWLEARPEVASVLCPMLPGSPGHDLWARDFAGGCGLFSFILEGRTAAHRARLIDALDLFGIGYSWGGYESLAVPVDPARARSKALWPRPEWAGDNRFGIRLSIGLEDAGDLIADLTRAFAAMEHE